MDCLHEWSDRVNDEQVVRVLDMGAKLTALPAEERPLKMTLIATQLWGEGVARSQEEAYVMLTDACVHAEVFKLMDQYDVMLKDMDAHMDKMMSYINTLEKDNQKLRAQLRIKQLEKGEKCIRS